MSAKSSRSSKPSGSRDTTELKRAKRQFEMLVRGTTFLPNMRPPNVTGQPWNSLVAIDVDVVKNKTYTVADVAGIICSQAGLYIPSTTTFIDVEFKLQRVSAWCETAHISLYPQDFINQKGVEMTRADGSMAKNQFARVGYSYPASHQSYTLTSSTVSGMRTIPLYTIATSANARIEVHIKLVWRSANSKEPTLKWVPEEVRRPRRCSSLSGDEDLPEKDVISKNSREISIEDLMDEVIDLRNKIAGLRVVEPT